MAALAGANASPWRRPVRRPGRQEVDGLHWAPTEHVFGELVDVYRQLTAVIDTLALKDGHHEPVLHEVVDSPEVLTGDETMEAGSRRETSIATIESTVRSGIRKESIAAGRG